MALETFDSKCIQSYVKSVKDLKYNKPIECQICNKKIGDEPAFIITKGDGLFSCKVDVNTATHFTCIAKKIKEQDEKACARLMLEFM